jgi:hypothetical protein
MIQSAHDLYTMMVTNQWFKTNINHFRVLTVLYITLTLLICSQLFTNLSYSLDNYSTWEPQCDVRHVSTEQYCLKHLLKQRIARGSNVIIVQVNKGFTILTKVS